jgi:hypothetical protein
MTYAEWINSVDLVVDKRTGGIGIGLDALPDWLSRDAYENGMSPEEGADECLLNAAWDDDALVLDEL